MSKVVHIFVAPERGAALSSRTVRAAVALILVCWVGAAVAQSYPNRPVRVIVPFQAGSAPDQVIRITTQHMQGTSASRS